MVKKRKDNSCSGCENADVCLLDMFNAVTPPNSWTLCIVKTTILIHISFGIYTHSKKGVILNMLDALVWYDLTVPTMYYITR